LGKKKEKLSFDEHFYNNIMLLFDHLYFKEEKYLPLATGNL